MVQTQCFIELDRGPNPNPHEKIFNIRGQPHQITAAQQMIMQKLDVREERERETIKIHYILILINSHCKRIISFSFL